MSVKPKHAQMDSTSWTRKELLILETLKTPYAIQQFLDSVEYSADAFYRCPRRVMADRKAHCSDGALFAAAALRRLGYPPLIMELRAVRDDDHLLAVFRRHGGYGAIAKSNFVTLRYREPVYRSLRELVMSYFEVFYNVEAEKTMRAYSLTLNLSRFDALRWTIEDEGIETIMDALDRSRHYPVMNQAVLSELQLVDPRSYEAGLIGSKAEGLYRPGEK